MSPIASAISTSRWVRTPPASKGNKYGSDNNRENYTLRMIVFNLFDSLGTLLKQGLADREILYCTQSVS